MQVFHPALKSDSLEAEDILLWKGTLKQVHEVFRREHGEHFTPCMRSAGCSMEQMLESKPSAFTERQMLAETSKAALSVICGATRWQWKNELQDRTSISTLWHWFLRQKDFLWESHQRSEEAQLGEVMRPHRCLVNGLWDLQVDSLVYRGKNRIRDWHQLVTEEVSELFIAVSPPVAVSGGIIWNVSIQVF